MSFKENLKTKIKLDRLYRNLITTMRDIPGQRYLNKKGVQELLTHTDLEPQKVRDLNLYVRPFQGEVMEVLVLDNELPIYHTTVSDVALRKSPFWKEMISFKNIKKILEDKDVIVSKGKPSLEHVHQLALDRLDLTYTKEDIEALLMEARLAVETNTLSGIRESFELFFDLLGFRMIQLGVAETDFQFFAQPSPDEHGQGDTHLILFNEESLKILLIKGPVAPQSDVYLAKVLTCIQEEKTADLEGAKVFEFLADMVYRKVKSNE